MFKTKSKIMLSRQVKIFVILIVLIANVGCDQVSKSIVREKVSPNEQISLMGDYLTLTKIENTGAFLSIGHSLPQPIRLILLIILPTALLGFALIYLLRRKDPFNLSVFGFCLISGGGLGNIYDRVVYGSVTDFLHIDLAIFQTGIFNLADVSVMAGTFIILVGSFIDHPKADLELEPKGP